MPLGSSSPENTTRNGRAQVPGRVDAELIEAGLAGPTRRQDRAPLDLTSREQDVVTLTLRGRSNKEIACKLSVSKKTVEYHLRKIYGKLGVGSRSEPRARFADSE
jgi:DNA-binding NarL/FixJ family response regulator